MSKHPRLLDGMVKGVKRMASKYKKGEVLTSLDELMQQEFVYWNDKINHKGWFGSWQLRMTENALKAGRICKAIKIESEDKSNGKK